jgi:transcriptional regulator with XRE-family HTH domain
VELVAQQFMRALRGKRSQRALARRLGYRGNPLTDWEHGRRYPSADEALRVAARVGVDVRAAFERFVPAVPLVPAGESLGLGRWLQQLAQNSTITQLSAQSGLSRFSLGRWFAEARTPKLPVFFHLVDVITGRLPDLVAELVSVHDVPALAQRYHVSQAARRVAFDEPWAEAIQRVLETAPCAAGAIARRLGISAQDEARILALMEAARLVRRRGRLYVPLPPSTVDTRGAKRASQALKQHWAQVAAERAAEPRVGDLFAYNVISVSAADLEQVRARLHATFREIRTIVAASEPTERVALVNLQLIGWNDDELAT